MTAENGGKSELVNLIKLLPELTELQVLDNSTEVSRTSAALTAPTILHWRDWHIIAPANLSVTPTWAKGIVERASECRR